jgi:hypothetical protein
MEEVVDEIWFFDRKYTRTHRDEDKYSAELTQTNPQNGAIGTDDVEELKDIPTVANFAIVQC